MQTAKAKPGRAKKLVEQLRDERDTADDGKPIVRVGVDVHRVVDNAIRALASDPGVFCRAHYLCTIARDAGADDAPSIRRMEYPTLLERLTAVARFYKHDARAGGYVPCTPPVSYTHLTLPTN